MSKDKLQQGLTGRERGMAGGAAGGVARPLPLVLAVGGTQEDWLLPDEVFAEAGCRLLRAHGSDQARESCTAHPPDLVFMPLVIEGRPATGQLRKCLAREPRPVVVVLASNDQIDIAAEAMRLGAHDCLFRPFSRARLARTIHGALKQHRRQHQRSQSALPNDPQCSRHAAPAGLRDPLALPDPQTAVDSLSLARRGFVTASGAMQALLQRARAVARSDAPVFISGETGSGKSWLAQIVHELSPRSARPLVTLTCAGLTPETVDAAFLGPGGALVRAAGGTLHLDELADLSPAVQPRVLHLLERPGPGAGGDGIRVIASTTPDPAVSDPAAMAQTGGLRPDLYYRLHVAPIEVPPLRARDGDAVRIARRRLTMCSEAEGRGFTGFSDSALSMIAGYDWPGNLRELINVVRSVVLLNRGPLVTPDLLPAELRAGAAPRPGPPFSATRRSGAAGVSAGRMRADGLIGMTLAEVERAVIEATIDAESGSLPRAARVLGVSPSTLYRKRNTWSKAGS